MLALKIFRGPRPRLRCALPRLCQTLARVKISRASTPMGRNIVCRKIDLGGSKLTSTTLWIVSLFESCTLPILCYGCEGLHFTNKVLNKFNVCWNNVYRIVFGMHKWESVKGIQRYCERLDCIRFIHNLKLKFYSRLCCSPNNVVSRCFNWFVEIMMSPSSLAVQSLMFLASFIYSVCPLCNYLSCISACTGLLASISTA